MNATGPLQGIRLVELISPHCSLAVRLSLAFAGRVACDLGAQVVVALESDADPLDAVRPFVEDRSTLSLFLNAHKRTMNARAAGELLKTADAVACDSDASAARRALAPAAHWLVSAAFDHPGGAQSEFTLMAGAGLLDLVGDPEREPLRLGGHQLAYSAGLALYSGLAAALCSGGAAQTVRVNLFDVAVWLNWKGVVLASWSDASVSRRGRNAEWCTVKCADGWVALVYVEADWPALRELVDDARLFAPRFDDRAERRRNSAFINDVIESALVRYSRAELREFALRKRLPLGPIWAPHELEQDPQNSAREFLRREISTTGEPLLLPRLPALWNGAAIGRTAL